MDSFHLLVSMNQLLKFMVPANSTSFIHQIFIESGIALGAGDSSRRKKLFLYPIRFNTGTLKLN